MIAGFACGNEPPAPIPWRPRRTGRLPARRRPRRHRPRSPPRRLDFRRLSAARVEGRGRAPPGDYEITTEVRTPARRATLAPRHGSRDALRTDEGWLDKKRPRARDRQLPLPTRAKGFGTARSWTSCSPTSDDASARATLSGMKPPVPTVRDVDLVLQGARADEQLGQGGIHPRLRRRLEVSAQAQLPSKCALDASTRSAREQGVTIRAAVSRSRRVRRRARTKCQWVTEARHE